MASAALEQVGAVDKLGLDREVAACFLARIARGYHGQPYHNALHGADSCGSGSHQRHVKVSSGSWRGSEAASSALK